MKVKLLKIVRRRYSVYRIDRLAIDTDIHEKHAARNLGLPVFRVSDSFDPFDQGRTYRATKEKAVADVWNRIIREYGPKYRRTGAEAPKVWPPVSEPGFWKRIINQLTN